MSTQELFQATKFEKNDAETVKDLKQVVADNRKNHQVDPVLEMELLRWEKNAGIKNPAQFDKEMEDMMVAARHQWAAQEKAGTLDESAKSRVEDSWEGVISTLGQKRENKIRTVVNRKTVNDY